MFTFRPTARLAKRLGIPVQGEQYEATNALGDWYANLLPLRPQHVVLCVSERSLLPVVVAGRDVRIALLSNFRAALTNVLAAIGVDPTQAQSELEAMRRFIVGKPVSSSVLGSMNDLAWGLECRVEADPGVSFVDLALQLGETPCGPLGYSSPIEVARRMLQRAAG